MHTLPDYDLHVPPQVRFVLIGGAAAGVLGLLLRVQWLSIILLVIALLVAIFAGLLLLILTPRGRYRARNLMQTAVAWQGHEQVLDVGCGNGIMTMGVAKCLTTGKVIGIDIWDANAGTQIADLFRRNAQLEGVADRVEVREADARQMPFEDESFDVIVSSLAMHHMDNRTQVTHEMMRVLKPGGTIMLYDMFPITTAAANVLRQGGWKVERLDGLFIHTLKAQKPH